MGAELLAGIAVARQLIGWITTQANLLSAQGAISDAELQQIRDAAAVSDAAWDEAVAAARARLGR